MTITGRPLAGTIVLWSAVAEVLVAFATIHLCFKAIKQLSALGAYERSAGINFIPGVMMALGAFVMISLGRREWTAYGLACPRFTAMRRWMPALISLHAVPLGVLLWLHPGGARSGALAFLGFVVFTAGGEELFFRGYAQSRLNRVFGRPWRMGKVDVGPGLFFTSALFGFLHGLNTVDYFRGHFDFAWSWAAITVASGLLFGILRERSSSVVTCIAIHGLLDAWVAASVLALSQ